VGLTRRDFLRYGSSAGALLALTSSLGGCSRFQTAALRVQVLDGSIPIQLPKKFRNSLTNRAKTSVLPTAQLSKSFRQLQRWASDPAVRPQPWTSRIPNPLRKPDRPADLITLGDRWLTAAIRQELITPLDTAELSRWNELPLQWQQLMQRNDEGFLEGNSPAWAAPYRWGSTVIAYRKNRIEKLGIEIKDWSDLWNPKLKGLLSLPDSPREVIGLTLKQLGQSYNHANPSQVDGLTAALASLQEQTKLYDSENYLQPLLLEDTWVAVGSSAELLPLLQRDRNLAIAFPSSGSALWADLWVKPKPFIQADVPAAEVAEATDAALASKWIDFCWSPEVVKLITNLSSGASPLATEPGLDWLSSLQNRELLLPDDKALSQSEFVLPLPQDSLDEYGELWAKMRRQELNT